MNDLFLAATVPILIVLLGAIYSVWDAWLKQKSDCDHNWSRWSDIKHGDGHPYQLRSCNKCNLHEQRIVQ